MKRPDDIEILKDHYFNQLNAFRKAVASRKLYDDKQMLFFWNLLETAYKRVGFDFGDRDDEESNNTRRDSKRVHREWWQD